MSTRKKETLPAAIVAQAIYNGVDPKAAQALNPELAMFARHPIMDLDRLRNRATLAEASLASAQNRLGDEDRRLELMAEKAVKAYGIGKRIQPITPEAAIKSLLKRIRGDGSSCDGYQTNVRKSLLSFVKRTREHHPVEYLSDITLEDVETEIDYLRAPKVKDQKTGDFLGEGKKPKTIKHRFTMIRELMAHAEARRWIEEDPTANKRVPKVPKGRIRFYSAEEVAAVFREAERNAFLSAVFAIEIYTGLRLDEVFKLRWDEVFIERRQIRLPAPKLDNKFKSIPIFDQLVPYLEALPRVGKTLFGEGRKKKALGRAVLRLVKRALPERAKETEEEGARRDGSQTARRTLATHLRALNVSAKRIASWLGHSVTVLEEDYCGLLPDGDRPLKITFLGGQLVTDGLPHPYPNPGIN